jgi:spermidine/putrescine transport system ATP-binding protein
MRRPVACGRGPACAGEVRKVSAIALDHVTKVYDGGVRAVDQVSLDVTDGELLVLLGPSGCGKTTLLRLLSGFEQPTSGSILIAGVDVTAVPPHRRDINQVFQSYALFPHLSVWDNIAFGLRMRGARSDEISRKVASAIALVSLGGLEARYAHQLSGGQRQRVALARAIVPEPSVLLLDEPLSALDAKLRREMQVELKRLQRKIGITTILVTHDQEEALAMSDRIAVMHGGHIEQLGTGKDVYHSPKTEFVAEFLGESNLVKAEILEVRGSDVRLRSDDGWLIDVGSPGQPEMAVGDKRTVSIRPEKLVISPEPSALNSIGAKIAEKTFLGPSIRFALNAESGRRLTVVAPESNQRGATGVGDKVYCSFNGSDAVILEAGSDC